MNSFHTVVQAMVDVPLCHTRSTGPVVGSNERLRGSCRVTTTLRAGCGGVCPNHLAREGHLLSRFPSHAKVRVFGLRPEMMISHDFADFCP